MDFIDTRALPCCPVCMKIDVDPNYLNYGRGRFSGCISASVPREMRADVKTAAKRAGISSAAFIRDAIAGHLRQAATLSNGAA